MLWRTNEFLTVPRGSDRASGGGLRRAEAGRRRTGTARARGARRGGVPRSAIRRNSALRNRSAGTPGTRRTGGGGRGASGVSRPPPPDSAQVRGGWAPVRLRGGAAGGSVRSVRVRCGRGSGPVPASAVRSRPPLGSGVAGVRPWSGSGAAGVGPRFGSGEVPVRLGCGPVVPPGPITATRAGGPPAGPPCGCGCRSCRSRRRGSCGRWTPTDGAGRRCRRPSRRRPRRSAHRTRGR